MKSLNTILTVIALHTAGTAFAQTAVDVDEMHADFTELVTDSTGSAAYIPDEYPAGYIDFTYVNEITGNTPYRQARRGIFVIGSGKNVRAFEAFGGTSASAAQYAAAINRYRQAFPDVNIWVMQKAQRCILL